MKKIRFMILHLKVFHNESWPLFVSGCFIRKWVCLLINGIWWYWQFYIWLSLLLLVFSAWVVYKQIFASFCRVTLVKNNIHICHIHENPFLLLFFFYPASQKDGFNRWPKNLPDFTAAENHHEEISWKEQRHLTLTIKLFGWIKRNVLPSFKTWLYFFFIF